MVKFVQLFELPVVCPAQTIDVEVIFSPQLQKRDNCLLAISMTDVSCTEKHSRGSNCCSGIVSCA